MPERHFAYAALQTFVQVRKLHIELHNAQFSAGLVYFYTKACMELQIFWADARKTGKNFAENPSLHRNMKVDSPLRLARRDSALASL
jgi:hypothetical protein